MVYTKYIYKNGKKFGPYYFKSERTKDGKVKSVYLGKKKPSNNLKLLPIFIGGLLLLSIFGYFYYSGFSTVEIFPQNDSLIQEEEIIENNSVVESEINITEINDSIEINITEINNSDNISEEINTSIEINITEINNSDNISEEINISINESSDLPTNESIQINQSEINNSTNTSYDIEEDVLVKINEPVKRTRNIKFAKTVDNYKLSLPSQAINLSIIGFKDNKRLEVSLNEEKENLITGNLVHKLEGFGSSLLELFSKIFSFTGFVVYDSKDSIIIKQPVEQLEIEYYLPGPIAIEKEIQEGSKVVEISSEIDYENVLVYSYLEGFDGKISVVDSNGNSMKYDSFDLNDDGSVDYIEWISPTSSENYTISITILNFQSFPVVGRNWTVMFNTTGVADLRITPINGTTWGTVGDENDLMFIDVKCGGDSFDSYWENETIVVANYSCSETGYESSRVRTSGGHYLEFDFGGLKAYARNDAACGDVINSDTTLTGDLINCAGSYGLAIQYNTGDFTLDCAGYMIDGTGGTTTTDGISLQNAHNVTIKNCVTQELEYGILSWGDANNNLIFNNTINARVRGIYLSDANYVGMENNSIIQNVIHNTTNDGIYLVRGKGYNISDNIIYGCGQYGVYPAYTINSLIANNRVENSSSSSATGIRPYRTQNISIISNSISSLGDFGIRVENANNSVIDSNIVSGLSDDGILVYSGSSFNLVKNNDVYDSGEFGIYLYSTNTINNTILNNNIHNNVDGIVVGIWNAQAGSNNLVINNSIYENSQYGMFINTPDTLVYGNDIYNNSYSGIYTYRAAASGIYPDRINISHNRIYQNTQRGLYLFGINHSVVEYNNVTDNWESSSYGGGSAFTTVHNNLIQNNIFSGAGHMGVRVYNTHINNTWKGNIIANNSLLAGYPEVYFCDSNPNPGCYNNRWIDTFVDPTNGGFYVLRAEGTQIIDFVSLGTGSDIYIDDLANNTLILNATADTIFLDAGGSCYNRSWYLDVNVSDGTNPLQDMNVSIFNNTDNLLSSELTNVNGRIIRKNITEYSYCPTTYTYYSNYTINTTDNLGGYSGDSTRVNMTTNKFLNIILSGTPVDTALPNITWESPTPNDGITIEYNSVYLNTTIVDESNTSAFFDWNRTLLGYWNFENILSNGTVYDNSSYRNDGIMNNFDINESSEGYYGNSLEFNGAGNEVIIQDQDHLDSMETLSVEAWVKAGETAWSQIIFKSSTFSLAETVGGDLRFDVYNATDSVTTGGALAIDDGEWHHVVGTYNGSMIVVYVDGIPDDPDYMAGNVRTTGADVSIGSSGGNNYFNGSIDEVRIYSRALTPVEINASMNNGAWRLYNNFTDLDNGVYNYSAYAIDKAGNLNVTLSRTVEVEVNEIPIMQSSRIDPLDPNASSDLVGYCNATDLDEDYLLYYYEWYNDNVFNQSGYNLNYSIIEDDTEDSANFTGGPFYLPAENAYDESFSTSAAVEVIYTGVIYINYTKPENAIDAKIEYKYGGSKCDEISRLSCYTGSGWYNIESWDQTGGKAITENVTLNGACFNQDPVQLRVSLHCADGFLVGSSSHFYEEKILWNVTGEEYVRQGIETEVNTLDGSYVSKGQNWSFNCMAYDGEDNASSWINNSVLIGNSPPIVQYARIDPTLPYTTDSLYGYCNATDIDGDNVSYFYQWHNDSGLVREGETRVSCGGLHNKLADGCIAIYRPNGTGDSEQFADFPSSGDNYEKVDENTPDEDSTYVITASTSSLVEQIAVKENGEATYSTKSVGSSYTDYTFSRETRPSDNQPWEVSDIEDLQIGVREGITGFVDLYEIPASDIPDGSTINEVNVSMRARTFVDKFGFYNFRVTQVWAEVYYIPPLATFEEGEEKIFNPINYSNTYKHQNWTFNCSAFDGIENASSWKDDNVTILNTAPNQVVLTSPAENSTITDRTPQFQWDAPADDDSDTLSYHLVVDNNIDFTSPIINLSPPGAGIVGTDYTPESDLGLDTTYYWKVRAYDGEEFGTFSNIWNFTLVSAVEISMPVNGINFGSMGPGTSNDTSDDLPPPFILQNDGNCLVNVSINATELFSQVALDDSAYQFKIDNVTGEEGAFNWLGSLFNWTNMPSARVVAIDSLVYDDTTDSAEIDIAIDILGYEYPGNKNSTVVFQAEMIE